MSKGPENKFRDKVIVPFLKSHAPDCYYFIKEAGSLRGIPDIIGSWNGVFFALEVKASAACAATNSGRIMLQRREIERIELAGGFASFVYPENVERVLGMLEKRANKRK